MKEDILKMKVTDQIHLTRKVVLIKAGTLKVEEENGRLL